MDKEAVFNKVKETMVGVFNLEPDSISPEKKLDDDLNLDSLDMVDFVIALNDQTDIIKEKLEPAVFKNVKTVQDVADILAPYLN